MRPTFTTGEAAGEGQHHRHLQEDAEEVADVVGAVLGEALGAIAALQQERLARRDLRQRLLQVARLAGKNQRRKGRKLRLDVGERLSRPDSPAPARSALRASYPGSTFAMFNRVDITRSPCPRHRDGQQTAVTVNKFAGVIHGAARPATARRFRP